MSGERKSPAIQAGQDPYPISPDTAALLATQRRATPSQRMIGQLQRMAETKNTEAEKQEAVEKKIAELIASGVDINVGDAYGDAPIHHAVRSGNIHVIAGLLSKGANINHEGSGGETPLHIAVERQNIAVATYLLEHGANPNLWSMGTPLHLAAKAENFDMMTTLLIHGAQISDPETKEETPLQTVAHFMNRSYPAACFLAAYQLREQGKDMDFAKELKGVEPKTVAIIQTIAHAVVEGKEPAEHKPLYQKVSNAFTLLRAQEIQQKQAGEAPPALTRSQSKVLDDAAAIQQARIVAKVQAAAEETRAERAEKETGKRKPALGRATSAVGAVAEGRAAKQRRAGSLEK